MALINALDGTKDGQRSVEKLKYCYSSTENYVLINTAFQPRMKSFDLVYRVSTHTAMT